MDKRISRALGTVGLIIVAGLPAMAAGSASAPIAIGSVESLQRIGLDPAYPLNGYYVLTQDIDASETAQWNNGAGFLPIGTAPSFGTPMDVTDEESPDSGGKDLFFNGWFDGQGYRIRGLYINRPENHGVGLFHTLAATAVVVNVGIEGGSITGAHYVGGLAGGNWSESVSACYSTAAVSGLSRIGSLIGINRGFIDACYATGPVQGDHFIGGLVGRNYKGVIQECYAAGPVSGNGWVGGLTGNAVEAEAIACFWDVTTSGTSFSAGGTGEPTERLLLPGTYTASGWDFTAIWDIARGKGYPRLKSLWK